MGRLLGLLLVLMAVLPVSRPVAAAEVPAVVGLRAASHDGITRFVLDMTARLSFSAAAEGQGRAVAIDLPDVDWRVEVSGPSRRVGLVQHFSYAPGRLTLQTDQPVQVKKAFLIPPGSETGNWRLVVDLAPGQAPAAPKTADQRAAPQPAVASRPPPPVKPAAPPPAPMAASGNPFVAPPPAPVVASGNPFTAQPTVVAVSPNAEEAPAKPADSPAKAMVASLTPTAAAAPLASSSGYLRHPDGDRAGDRVASGPLPAAAPRAAEPPPAKPVPAVLPAAPVEADGEAKAIPAALPLAPEPPAAKGRKPGRSPGKSPGKPVVVIDPGHGGPDPGATSLTGVYEKTIVLALALDVKAQLDKGGKVQAVLTRDHDVFIPLRDRVAFARSAKADLFMSLHADTVDDPEINGLSVYTLSRNASDAEAQALADKENKSDIVAGLDLSKESPEVTNILIDLVQRETMNLSAVFATKVIAEVSHDTHELLQNTHRFAGFAVLKAPDVPSILVETGYLSNAKDEQMLRRPDYRAKLARALARAIEKYFAQTQKARRT